MRAFSWALATVFVAVSLAGCLGGEGKVSTDDGLCKDERCDPTKGVNEDDPVGRITGKVADDSFNKIVGAIVTLRERNLTTLSNAEGQYAFNDLEPAIYTVFASKPPTHIANGRQVEVKAGAESRADIQLTLVPPPAKPYKLEHDFNGLICATAAAVVEPPDLCGSNQPAGGQADAKSTFNFTMNPGVTGIVLHIEAQPDATGQEKALVFQWNVPIPLSSRDQHLRGSSPITNTWTFDDADNWTHTEQNAKFTFRLDGTAPQVAYQLKVDTYIGVFYNGEPIPDGYSPAPEG